MAFALLYLALRRLVAWTVGSPRSDRSKDLETLVLRRQLKVLALSCAARPGPAPRRAGPTWSAFLSTPPEY